MIENLQEKHIDDLLVICYLRTTAETTTVYIPAKSHILDRYKQAYLNITKKRTDLNLYNNLYIEI